jgi:hypothetical protein
MTAKYVKRTQLAIFELTAGTDLGDHHRIDGREPLLARQRPGNTRIHESDDRGQRFCVKSSDLSTPEVTLLQNERSEDTSKQAALGERGVLLNLFDRRVERVSNQRQATARSTPQFLLKPNNRQPFDVHGFGRHTLGRHAMCICVSRHH